MFKSHFESNKIQIPDDVKIIFVNDFFANELTGGAELTSEALIESSPFNIYKLHSRDVTLDIIQKNSNKFWIFGNYAHMNLSLISDIIANLKYSILEYDYKYCKLRSPKKHISESGECDCHNDMHGRMIFAFMHSSRAIWWMSEKQMNVYLKKFPQLSERNNTVLSSVFSKSFFEIVNNLKLNKNLRTKKWGVLGSSSWVKGTQAAIDYCLKNNLDYEIISGLKYDEMLQKLSELKGLVFLPAGSDTCPRIVIEAKLLGCELILNENVQHKDESWFTGSKIELIAYLNSSSKRFWSEIERIMNHRSSISGYTTTLNCIENGYPWKQSIQSMLGFCDEVIVVDGGSHDGTYEYLETWQREEKKLKIYKISRDWNHQRFALFDGAQKAEARKLCTKEFCWQQDADEIVHENDYEKIHRLISRFPPGVSLISLPVIEFWGDKGKIRMDVTPWKWRVSKNIPTITHGVPRQFHAYDDKGHLYALQGTDGCDYIDVNTYEPVPHMSFYTQQIQQMHIAALFGSQIEIKNYSFLFQKIIEQLPSVYHYSWYNLERKIKTYKNYWSKHWQSLYNIPQVDTAESNMFFDKPWCKVTEDDITELAIRLEKEMSGWVFHQKIDFNKPTPSLNISITQPAVMRSLINST